MHGLTKLITLLFIIFCSHLILAKTTLFNDVKDLKVVKMHLDAGHENSHHLDNNQVLVIFDIDDTLLESINFVGSNKWYDWQRGRTVYDDGNPITIDPKDKFSCIFSTLGTLFDLGTSKLTQPDAASIIKQLYAYDLMLLTARTYNYRRATERELTINDINVSEKHLLKDNASLDFTFNDKKRADRVTYQNGLVMASGLNKGLVLREVLSRIGKSYHTIYFVDDSRKNVMNMNNEWLNDTTMLNIFHYTKIDKSISAEEISQSKKAKYFFDHFLSTAYPDRAKTFANNQCR